MKRFLLLAMALLPFTLSDARTRREYSKTFMFTHPVFERVNVELAGWHTLISNELGCTRVAVQVTGIYQNSKPSKGANEYFLKRNHSCLSVAGDQSFDVLNRDIRAEWLGINNPQFFGTFTLSPSQRQYAVIPQLLIDLNPLNIGFFKDSWLDIRIPIVSVRNNINLCQSNIQNRGTGPVYDIASAFVQPDWCYAKMGGGNRSRAGIGEFRILIGSTYLARNGFEMNYYTGFSIPGAGGQSPEYVFPTFVGYNSHVGFVTGINFQVNLNNDTMVYPRVAWFVNFDSIWLIKNRQYRTLDLRFRPLSRYLQFNKINGLPDQNIPGVNILTCRVSVRPYDLVEFSTGLRIFSNYWQAELGYGIWGHGEEKLRLAQDFPEIYGIAGTGSAVGPFGREVATSASCSTIAYQAPNDVDRNGTPVFIPITAGDLDLCHGGSSSALNHIGHASISLFWNRECTDRFINVGGFIEYPQYRGALQLWGIWCKFARQF
ncbi:hypothetical protein KG892_04475 [Vermiphilus pyriformis]|nr:MAG: hypothetical protein KG892_04475 [Vermiphilus pyriformis]